MKIKKYICLIIAVLIMIETTSVVLADEYEDGYEYEDFNSCIGTYYQMGHYNGEPILWKCVDVDDEGVLIMSHNVLCLKAYSGGRYSMIPTPGIDDPYDSWETSNIRAWLNSTEKGGNVKWVLDNTPKEKYVQAFPYDQEDGFLSSTNFTDSELSLMKTIYQWQVLNRKEAQKTENGIKFAFGTSYYYPPYTKYGGYEQGSGGYDDISDFAYIAGAMYRLEDTVFLIDERQGYNIWENFGTLIANPTDILYEEVKDMIIWPKEAPLKETRALWSTLLRSDRVVLDGTKTNVYSQMNIHGIRPAFYLNTDRMTILSGSGTETDPYIIDGIEQEGTAVFCNGDEVYFDQEPVEENDRLLVPARAIFESLGAEVTYDDGDGVIIAKNDERTVVMQIDNPDIGNGYEVITLDVPPRLIGDRTMVPLRAISEAFDCKVSHTEELNRVSVDKPKLPMDFGEKPEKPKENWQTEDFFKLYGEGWEPF